MAPYEKNRVIMTGWMRTLKERFLQINCIIDITSYAIIACHTRGVVVAHSGQEAVIVSVLVLTSREVSLYLCFNGQRHSRNDHLSTTTSTSTLVAWSETTISYVSYLPTCSREMFNRDVAHVICASQNHTEPAMHGRATNTLLELYTTRPSSCNTTFLGWDPPPNPNFLSSSDAGVTF